MRVDVATPIGRDVLIFFGWQSDTEFYYVHLSEDTHDYVHNGIFKVDNADRLRRLGVSRTLAPKHFDGPALAGVLDELLRCEQTAKACRAVAERFRGADPVGETCRLIEEASGVA